MAIHVGSQQVAKLPKTVSSFTAQRFGGQKYRVKSSLDHTNVNAGVRLRFQNNSYIVACFSLQLWKCYGPVGTRRATYMFLS